MSSLFRRTHFSVLIGFLAAAIGFSYALATSSTPDSASASAAPFAAGAKGSNPRLPLNFTDPFVNGSTDRDLGDAALGSNLVRYIHASGGFSPYRFTSDRTTLSDVDQSVLFIGNKTLGEAEIGLPSSASGGSSTALVFLNGLLNGKVGAKTGTITDGTPLRFDVTVVDSKGTPEKHNETFRLTMFGPNGKFKFAQNTLNSAIQFNKYYDKVEVLYNGGPVTFTASNVKVTPAPATPVTSLADIGLFLVGNTGVVTGRPTVFGTISFDVDCVDNKSQAHALSRDLSKTGQNISFNVAPATHISSDLFSTKLSIKANEATGGKDTIQYSGVLNLAGKTVSNLDGLAVTLSIANYSITSGALSGGKVSAKGPPSMKVSIGSDGTIAFGIGGESFGQALTILGKDLTGDNRILPVTVIIGDPAGTNSSKPAYQSSELLKFHLGVKKSTNYDLEYKFGPGNLGGGFIITGVAGKDSNDESGDAWSVKFLSLPPSGSKLSSFGAISQTTVGIGTDFTSSIGVTVGTDGSVKSANAGAKSGPIVLKASYNAKSGQGSVTTGVLPTVSALPNTQTGIKAAFVANGKTPAFPFIITFDDVNGKELIGFEGSRKIIPKGNQWISKDLSH